MDVRRFVTLTKALVVRFLYDHLNSVEFADLWTSCGETGKVGVSVTRPNWVLSDALETPMVLLEKIAGETQYSTVPEGQYLVEGYWKEMTLSVHACTDEKTGGRIAVDDLSSSIELCFAKYADELADDGVQVLQLLDAAENDAQAEYQNTATLVVRVLVPGANIQPSHIELGRLVVSSPGVGTFYAGTTLDEAQSIEMELMKSTSASDATVTVTARNQNDVVCTLHFAVPRASISGTRISPTGGNPTDTYKRVTNMVLTGGQAGYNFAIYNKIGA